MTYLTSDYGDTLMQIKCRIKFEKSKLQRLSQPFDFSLYKLRERSERFQLAINEVKLISQIKRNRNSEAKYDLRCCRLEDMHIYLKALPINIAEQLGYNVVFAIDGLAGDGLSSKEIKALKLRYVPQIESLIERCDLVANRIRNNINYEYENFRNGESDLFELASIALDITDNIIADAGF